MQELWHPIEGAEGYEVSNLGRVRVTRYLQTARGGSNGYRTCTLPGGKQRYVHRLVAEAFIDNPEDLPEVNHIDSDPSNAAASNLEWVDSQQNKVHAIRHGNRKRKLLIGRKMDVNDVGRKESTQEGYQFSRTDIARHQQSTLKISDANVEFRIIAKLVAESINVYRNSAGRRWHRTNQDDPVASGQFFR